MKMLDYTLSHGQRHYVTLITELYTNLMKPKGITSEVTKQGNILGWSIELVSERSFCCDTVIFSYFYGLKKVIRATVKMV